jgi:16S rRNA (adenine1518-N6/adenine1519-N6)-dimethyltransferase
MMQAFFEVELIFTVPPESFEPAPKVDSAIVYLKPLAPSKVSNTELIGVTLTVILMLFFIILFGMC